LGYSDHDIEGEGVSCKKKIEGQTCKARESKLRGSNPGGGGLPRPKELSFLDIEQGSASQLPRKEKIAKEKDDERLASTENDETKTTQLKNLSQKRPKKNKREKNNSQAH